MYPYTDARTMLDLHHQHADELRREAAAHRRSRAVRRVRRTSRRGRHAGGSTLS